MWTSIAGSCSGWTDGCSGCGSGDGGAGRVIGGSWMGIGWSGSDGRSRCDGGSCGGCGMIVNRRRNL
jgi:hypothetical protein